MNNGFAGLPPELISELLASADGITSELTAPLKHILENRDGLRAQLSGGKHLIRKPEIERHEASGSSVIGVDMFSGTVPAAGGSLSCTAAFAVEGFPAPGNQLLWDNPRHAVMIRTEKKESGTDQLLHAVACEAACELAATAPHDIILYNGSAMHLFQAVMESLVPAMGAKQTPSGMEYLKRLKSTLAAFGKMFLAGNDGSLHAGIVSSTPKQEISRILGLTLPLDDTTIMTLLLEPGEATAPVTIDSGELRKTAALPIKDESFLAIRDRIVKAIELSCVLYYRPYEWTPAFRIELPGTAAADTETTASLLGAVSRQCATPGSRLPYPLEQAGSLTRSMSHALKTIGTGAVTRALETLADGQGADPLAAVLLNKIST